MRTGLSGLNIQFGAGVILNGSRVAEQADLETIAHENGARNVGAQSHTEPSAGSNGGAHGHHGVSVKIPCPIEIGRLIRGGGLVVLAEETPAMPNARIAGNVIAEGLHEIRLRAGVAVRPLAGVWQRKEPVAEFSHITIEGRSDLAQVAGAIGLI